MPVPLLTTLLLILAPPLPVAGPAGPSVARVTPAGQDAAARDERAELVELLAEERVESDRLRRRGQGRAALRLLDEHVEDDPGDADALALRARVQFDLGHYAEARGDALAAWECARDTGGPTATAAALELARQRIEFGEAASAVALLEDPRAGLAPELHGAEAWLLARALREAGRRAESAEQLTAGARTAAAQDWRDLLGKGRCLRALGRFQTASEVLVQADAAAARADGVEPDVLVELGELYFEVDGEVDQSATARRRPAPLFREALTLHPTHEGALLGLFALHRFNWNRTSRSAASYLDELFAVNPGSLGGLLAGLSSDLDDGNLRRARGRLARLEQLAPERRDVLAERATLLWIEHDRDGARALLAELAETDAGDSGPERALGTHLLELYRFAEGKPFLEAAVQRDPTDLEAWTQLGRALANTGDEPAALEALEHADEVAAGRKNAWRFNMQMVLKRMRREMVEEEVGDLTFVWRPSTSPLLALYSIPFYQDARADFSRRYGYTSGPVRIEVFERHGDFSVRSVGFEGFPALGVCFGPVVTSLSPLSELRGQNSWARTAYHEFSHVIHLGLSHNRCPRWITEGLATYEEVRRNPAWTRNMRRDLLDARANGMVVPVRELNGIFRTSRITFGYYQGGLLCDMLIREHGFAPMVRLLEAFDRGLDLDTALDEVFDRTPEQIDAAFAVYVDEQLAGLALEPRWHPHRVRAQRFKLSRTAPEDADERAEWAERWCDVAWGNMQIGRDVDAQEVIRLLHEAGVRPARIAFLRSAMAAGDRDLDKAAKYAAEGIERGGEDFSARVLLAENALIAGELEEAERQYLAAEAAYPGFPDPQLCAELSLAVMYDRQERVDEAMAARERWLAWDASDYDNFIQVARWHAAHGRWEEASLRYLGANEVDPFSSELHDEWATALWQAERYEECLRETRAVRLVPTEVDRTPQYRGDERDASALALGAECLVELERPEDARRMAEAALELDDDQPAARAVLEQLP